MVRSRKEQESMKIFYEKELEKQEQKELELTQSNEDFTEGEGNFLDFSGIHS